MTLSNLVYKRSNGEASSSKLWLNITNTAIVSIYVALGLNQYHSTTPDLEGIAILTFVLAAIVTGNKLANDLIKMRFGASVGQGDTVNVRNNEQSSLPSKHTGSSSDTIG